MTTEKLTQTLDNLDYACAHDLVTALVSGAISSSELLECSISRIEQYDRAINAVIVRDFENVRQQAQLADAAIARGERLPLLGLPMTVKESFHTKGLPTSWGLAPRKDWQAPADALSIKRFKAAGAIILGKTNVPEMLKDWQTYNDIYGVTNNPWDVTRGVGGSSGGSAAALASGYVSLELGSDMAGSLRVPAHCCGVYAHKPSFNLIPNRGASPPKAPVIPGSYINDFGVVGPLARSANDLRLALNILADPDPMFMGKGYALNLPQAKPKTLKDFRVLVLKQHPLCPISDEVNSAITRFTQQLAELGVRVSDACQNLPDLSVIAKNFALLLTACIADTLSAEVYEQQQQNVANLAKDDDSFKSYLLRGFVLNHRDWLKATRERLSLREQWRALYQNYDVILMPAFSTPAFEHDFSPMTSRQLSFDGQTIPYSHQHVWQSVASLFGLPVTLIPIQQQANKFPVGLQVMGDYLDDNTTIKFAELVEEAIGGFKAPILQQEIIHD